MNPIYKRITCLKVECAKVTHRRVNSMSNSFNSPCKCKSGVLIKVVNGKETTSDNDVNPRVFFKRKFRDLSEVEA